MITRITQKKYYESKRRGKYNKRIGRLSFRGKDGLYYEVDRSDMLGVREMFEWNRNIEKQYKAQKKLL